MKKIAILVYIPNQPALIQQFFALYASVMINPSLRKNIDFLIGCETHMHGRFVLDNCKVVFRGDLSSEPQYRYLYSDEAYGYINSWAHFTTRESIDLILQYQYALRIDVDTFLSPNIIDLKVPNNEIFTGVGGYVGGEDTKENIKRVASALNIEHRGIFNTGSTWFANAEDIVNIGIASLKYAQYLLRQEFKQAGKWPAWYAPVTTMYAGELALNDSGLKINTTEKFDAKSTSNLAVNEIYTLHCWHTDEFFSKHHYIAGNYSDRPLNYGENGLKEYAYLMTQISELIVTKNNDNLGRREYTPKEAILTGMSLIYHSIPYLPRLIVARIKRIFR